MIPRFKAQNGFRELVAPLLSSSRSLGKFEEEFARTLDARHAIAFPYGRTALMFLLEALDLKGKEIICPSYTCIVVPHAIVYAGGIPVFVDSQSGDLNMDLNLVEQAITEKTGAIIATSLFGFPVDLDHLQRIQKKHPNIHIIQDCAHSFGAAWEGTPVQKAGVASVYGLNISKLIHSIKGGMITTDNHHLAARLYNIQKQRLSDPGALKSVFQSLYLWASWAAFTPLVYPLTCWLEKSGYLDRLVKYYEPDKIDMPADYLERMTATQAEVGRTQVLKYQKIVARRIKIAKFYHRHLKGVEGIEIGPEVEGCTYSHFIAWVDNRDKVIQEMAARGIQLGTIIDYNIASVPAYKKYKTVPERAPVAEESSRKIINLPLHISAKRAQRVVKALLKTIKDK